MEIFSVNHFPKLIRTNPRPPLSSLLHKPTPLSRLSRTGASPIWSLCFAVGFGTRRLSGAVRSGLRDEAVERRDGTSFADLVTGLHDEAVERCGGTLGFLTLGFADLGFATRRRFMGSLGLRGLLGLWFFCCDGVCGFAVD